MEDETWFGQSSDDVKVESTHASQETPSQEEAQPPVGESVPPVTASEPAAEPTEEPGEDPGLKPEGPGDLRVALKQSRERERESKAQAATLQAQALSLQTQLVQYQQYLASLQAQQQQGQAFEPVDPEAYEAIQAEVARVRQESEQNLQEIRVSVSADFARQRYTDYDDKMKALADLVAEGVVNLEAFTSARNPAEAAYQFISKVKGPVAGSNLDEVQVRADERRKVLEEQAQAARGGKPPTPPSLSSVPAARDAAGEHVEEPEVSWAIPKRL